MTTTADEWISVKDPRKPQVNTWIEVLHKLLDDPLEFFYDKDGFTEPYTKNITHWRNISHPFFDRLPVYSVELPIPAEGER